MKKQIHTFRFVSVDRADEFRLALGELGVRASMKGGDARLIKVLADESELRTVKRVFRDVVQRGVDERLQAAGVVREKKDIND